MLHFTRRNPAVLFALGIKRGVGDTQLAADFRHGRTQLSLLQGKDKLSLQ